MTPVRRRLAQVVALAAAATALGLWLKQDYQHRSDKVAGAQARAQLVHCAPGQAGPVGFVLTTPRVTVALHQDAQTGWRLVAPIEAQADNDTVAAFLAATCGLQRVGAVRAKAGEPALDLALFNLASPPHHLSITHADDSVNTLALGDASPFDGTLFVRVGDAEDVDRVSGDYAHQLQRDLFAWRDKRALPDMPPDSITQVAVQPGRTPAQGFILSRNSNTVTGFAVRGSGPDAPELAADAVAAEELVQALSQTRAQSFVAEKPTSQQLGQFGLQTPTWVVTVTTRAGATHRVRIGSVTLAQDAHHFLQVGDAQAPIMQLPGDWLTQKFVGGAQAFVDMRVLHVDAERVRSVVLHAGRDALSLVRADAAGDGEPTWHLAGVDADHPGAALDNEGMRTRLHHLLNMRAAAVLTRHATEPDLLQAHLSAPQRSIELFAEGGRPLATLWMGRSDGSRVMVTDDKKQVLCAVFTGTLDAFSLDANSYLPQGHPPSL